jgi:hypothetical protein
VDFDIRLPKFTQSSFMEDIAFSFSFFWLRDPNEDDYFEQQFRHQL